MSGVSPRSRVQLMMIALLLWLWSDGVQAQTTSFNYQGRLADGANAANGVYDLQFRLVDALTGGIQVGTNVVRDDVAVTNGIFSVTVDFGASAFPGANRWLEISVRLGASTGSYTALAPLQPIVSTPYAMQSLKAANALQLGGVNSDQYVLTTDPRLSDLNCPNPCVSSSEIVNGAIVNVNISASAGIEPTKIAGTAATLGANSFNATQTIGSGNVGLTNSTNANTGVMTLGGNPFLHNFGPYNTFVGQNAGNFTMTGVGINTAIGSLAFSSNTTGISNTAIGSESLFSNTTGNTNAAMGRRALFSNTVGFGNTASGAHSLYSNVTGTYNTASGYDALRNNNGGSNTATGTTSLYSNTTGFINTASGYDTLRNNTTGSGNTAGGASSLYFNTTGTYNTALGVYAGDTVDPANANTTGSYNTFIGTQSGPGTPTQLNNATAIGANARVSASNALVLGDSAVSVGIGTSSPTAKLDVNGTVKAMAFVGDGAGLTNLPVGGTITDVNCPGACISTGEVVDGTITDADIDASAGIAPTKIAGTAATLGANSFSGTQTISTGNLNLTNSTSATTGVITLGSDAFLHNFGLFNTFLGINAGNFTMTGDNNTASGRSALSSNTTGFGNMASGTYSLFSNTSGGYNTASGWGSLASNTMGNDNTATGWAALYSNTAGSNNTASGRAALYSNTTGSYNTAYGRSAGYTALGSNANTTGSSNTFIGYQAGPGTSTQLNNSTAIGANALVSASNALVLGDSAVSVGIGTSSPTAKLDVNGTVKATAFVGDGAGLTNLPAGAAATDVNCAASCISTGEIVDGTIENADISSAAAISPTKIAGTAATLGTNAFSGTQSIGGNVNLSATLNASVGVITSAGYPFLHTFGSWNTFVGRYAGNFAMTGAANSAIGMLTLSSNTTGQGNTASGYNSLFSNTTGNHNTASGPWALFNNTAGSWNIATGSLALYSNTIGESNTATGMESLHSNTTGSHNTAAGTTALYYNTTGVYNTAAGSAALYLNTTGSFNTATGRDALGRNTTGTDNVADGYYALVHNTTGNNNTAVGRWAGTTGSVLNANTTGSSNTFIGYQAGPGTSTQLDNATSIGANALVSASNALVLGDNSVNVGIGTSVPLDKLDVRGDIRVGTGTFGCVKDGDATVIAGTCSSDARLKQNVEPFEPVLEKLMQIQPVHFDWRAADFPEMNFGLARSFGLIAQEVEKVIPEMVVEDARGYKAVKYNELPLLLLQAVHDLKAENDKLQKAVDTLNTKMEALRAVIRPEGQ